MVYIPSFNESYKHLAYSYKKKFSIVGSAHNIKEIRIKKIKMLVKYFYLLYLKKIKIFRLNKLKILLKNTNKKVVVLGGISKRILRN